jgi:hypothetical protein
MLHISSIEPVIENLSEQRIQEIQEEDIVLTYEKSEDSKILIEILVCRHY